MDRVLDDHPADIVLPPAAAREFRVSCFIFLTQYNLLASRYNIDGDMIFNITPKCHMVAHIGLTAHEINPRRTWCFSGERMMFLVRRLGQSCCRGIKPQDIGWKLLSKYRIGLNLIFSETSEWFDDDELEWLLAGADDGDGAVPFS